MSELEKINVENTLLMEREKPRRLPKRPVENGDEIKSKKWSYLFRRLRRVSDFREREGEAVVQVGK